jgi:hypothetical protein
MTSRFASNHTHDSIMRVLRAMAIRDSGKRRKAPKPRAQAAQRGMSWVLIWFPSMAFILSAGWAWWTKSEDAKTIALLSLLALYAGILVWGLASAFLNRKSIAFNLCNPFHQFLLNARSVLDDEDRYGATLMRRNLLSLEYALLALKTERDHLERRMGILVGSLHKVGLGPALIGAALVIHQLWEKDLQLLTPVMALAYAIPCLYMIASYAEPYWMRLDRNIRLFEHLVTEKKANPPKTKVLRTVRAKTKRT